mmetsp:Transcript_37041/g.59475  ORF Transcript_37041/g.59475 Transcript_37041/m.59475 type:complete len:553 (+) Transcript_37041:676-2334(+)
MHVYYWSTTTTATAKALTSCSSAPTLSSLFDRAAHARSRQQRMQGYKFTHLSRLPPLSSYSLNRCLPFISRRCSFQLNYRCKNCVTPRGRTGGGGGNNVHERLSLKSLSIDGTRKRHMNIIFIGHVDAGKSTIAGHILAMTGSIDERTMAKCEKDARDRGRESWKYAYALDTTEGERNKGKTEECGQAYFETDMTRFTILDAPGHKGYVPHMIGGASQADVGILIISGRKGEFETGFDKGGQTREHALLAKSAGVKKLVVCINKLDDNSVVLEDGKTWSKSRFEEIQNKLLPFLKHAGWRARDVTVLPISGLQGEGLVTPPSSSRCPFYSGPSLIEILDNLQLPNDDAEQKDIIFPVVSSYKERDIQVTGKLESGILKVGDVLKMLPEGKEITVNLMTAGGEDLNQAFPGESLRLSISGHDLPQFKQGSILTNIDSNLTAVVKLEATLMVMNAKHIITPGYSAVMHIHAAEVPCTIYKLTAELNRKSGEVVRRHPHFAKTGSRVNVKILLDFPTVAKPYKEISKLGRFMLRADGKTVAVGTVLRTAKMLESQ